GRRFVVAEPSVDYDVHGVVVLFVDELGIGGVLDDLIVVVHRRGDDGIAETSHEFPGDVVVGYAYPDGSLVVFEDFGDAARAVEDKGEWPGKGLAHHFVVVVSHVRVRGDVAQVFADNGEVGLFRFQAFQLGDFGHGFHVVHVATDAVHGIGGVDDHTSVAEDFNNLIESFWIGIIRMDIEKHKRKFGWPREGEKWLWMAVYRD